MKAWQEELDNPTPKTAELVKRRPHFGVSLFVLLIGLGALFFFWPLGLLLIVGGVLLDRTTWLCGACGNKAEKTSRMCPVCRTTLR